MAIFVPGIPRPQGSKRHVGNGRMIEASKYVDEWRKHVSVTVAMEWNEDRFLDPTTPVKVHLNFRMPKVKKPKAYAHVVRPDIDKLARAVLDAITGLVFWDDSQVVQLLVTKCYDQEPGVVIRVSQSGNECPNGDGVYWCKP